MRKIYNTSSLPPLFLKHYKIVKILHNSAGQYTSVYLATDLRNGKKVVIKCDKSARKEFNILQKLDHPNIVKGYDYKEKEGYFFLIKEYIEGDTLNNYNKKNAPLKEDHIKALFLPLFNAINYIHTKHKLVHGDITVGNIMIRKKDHSLILIDFGSAYKNGNYLKFKIIFMNLWGRGKSSYANCYYEQYRKLVFMMLRCMTTKGGYQSNYPVRITQAEKNGYSECFLNMIKKTLMSPNKIYYDEWVEFLKDK